MGIALVVEDSLTDLQIITGCLQYGGINVLTARSREEAIFAISKQRPDVVILDIVLPDSNGFKICRELKAQVNTSDIPIVICSTKGSEMDKFWGIKQGADAYLVKPIDQDDLVRTVKLLIRN
ncbi:MAG: response regulator [Leptolyngbyaceae cyanobacterium CRU_2_3]|nr:response regulator [Leptolyngbyaceae cyanobacterium CRU_2_3]